MRNLQGKFVSSPPAHQVHPRQRKSRFFTSCWAGEIWRWECFI